MLVQVNRKTALVMLAELEELRNLIGSALADGPTDRKDRNAAANRIRSLYTRPDGETCIAYTLLEQCEEEADLLAEIIAEADAQEASGVDLGVLATVDYGSKCDYCGAPSHPGLGCDRS